MKNLRVLLFQLSILISEKVLELMKLIFEFIIYHTLIIIFDKAGFTKLLNEDPVFA